MSINKRAFTVWSRKNGVERESLELEAQFEIFFFLMILNTMEYKKTLNKQ